MKTVLVVLLLSLAGCADIGFHATYDGVALDAEVWKDAKQ